MTCFARFFLNDFFRKEVHHGETFVFCTALRFSPVDSGGWHRNPLARRQPAAEGASDVEYWTVGVLGDAKPVEELLRASIFNDCEIAFQPARYSRNEIRALYPEVVRRYCRNIGCSAVVISGDQIVIRFSPLLMGLYQKSAARDYGGRVRFQSSLSYHFEGYDENGNYIHDFLPDMTFELFAGIALVLLILILLTFGVLSLIRLFLRRRKRAGKPSQKLLDKLQGGESP